ncbi:MAG TPA: hypothetical protein VJB08_01485 [Candidatus Nanoarchaeia archaeon]|nr:hypothetical protein [Candidatus Nanoarchaeia archaeon]
MTKGKKADITEGKDSDFKDALALTEQAQRVVAGRSGVVEQALYDAAMETLYDPATEELNYTNLSDPGKKAALKSAFGAKIKNRLGAALKADTSTWNIFQAGGVANGFYGVTPSDFDQTVEALGPEFSVQAFLKDTEKGRNAALQQILQVGYSGLKQEHAADLVKHIGLEDIVDPSKMTTSDMVDLLNRSKQPTLEKYAHRQPYAK